jgi:AcrR family transcriptional regulator
MKERAFQQARSPKRRRQILEATLACFSEAGFDQTTMEDIRRRSGASTGSLYHHFTNKEQLAAALYLEGLRNYQQGLLAELKRHKKARAGLTAIVRYHLTWVAEHTVWARYLFQMRHAESVATTEPLIVEQNQAFMAKVFEWIDPLVEKGEVKRLPRDLYLPMIIGSCHEFARLWLAGRTETETAKAAGALAQAVWTSLGAETKK